MRLLLHACCGPCLIEPLDAYLAETDEVTVIYANPNIHPLEEYVRRRDTLLAYAENTGASIVELDYDPAQWVAAVGPHVAEPAERCRACFRLRLGTTARYAAEHGYDAIATTLSVSPYQDPDALREEGEAAAASAGVAWLGRDFRDRYADATRRSRELELYRQNYCGCIVSAVEADAARRERRARRAAERAARHADSAGS